MTTSFDPQRAFLDAFEAELDQYEGEAFTVGGRPSKAYPHGEDADWWRAQGPIMVQRYMEWRDSIPWRTWVSPDGVLGVELGLLTTIGGLRLPTKLFIDRVFDTGESEDSPRLIIVDVKSGGRPPAGDIQLGLYRCALLAQWPGLDIAGGCYWLGRTGETTPVVSLDHFTPEYISSLQRRHLALRAMGAFIPRQSLLCRGCKVGKYCAINDGSMAHMDPDYALMRGAKTREGSTID